MHIVPPSSESYCIQLIPIMFMLTPCIEVGISAQMIFFCWSFEQAINGWGTNQMAENPPLKY